MAAGDTEADYDYQSVETEYKVEKVVDRRIHKGKLQYCIKWEGYPVSDNTWEDANQLDIPEIIDQFEKARDGTDENYDDEDSYDAESSTLKNGRGHPHTKDDEDYDYDFKDEIAYKNRGPPSSAKRGRGRPPKNPDSAAKAKPTPSKQEAPSKNGEMPKRGRGRPPKSATTTPKMNGHVTSEESDTSSSSSTYVLAPSEVSSSNAPKSPRKRGRPPKSLSKSAADAIIKKAKMSPIRRSESPAKNTPTKVSPANHSPVKETPTKYSPSKEAPNIDSPRRRIFSDANESSAKPLKVIGLQLNGPSYQYLVKCQGETDPRKFSSIDAKNKFPDLVVDFYEKTAVVSAIKIHQTAD